MTLHEAIEHILVVVQRPLSFAEIADKVNELGLYQKNDGTQVTSGQISARVKKYKEIFSVDTSGVSLHDIELRPYKELSQKLSSLLYYSGLTQETISELIPLVLFLAHEGLTWEIEPSFGYNSRLNTLFRKVIDKYWSHLKEYEHLVYKLEEAISEKLAHEIWLLLEPFSYLPFDETITSFSDFFNDSVNEYTIKNNLRGGGHSTPKAVSFLISKLISFNGTERVFDPFAGKTGIIHSILKQNRVEEIIAGDYYLSAGFIGVLNILTHHFFNFTYFLGDAFSIWDQSVNADIIVSSPPFSVRQQMQDAQNWQKINSNDSSVNSVQLALYHTNTNGKIILVLPESFLTSNKKENVAIRQFLIRQGYLKGVILLPKDTFRPLATINTALVIIDKSYEAIDRDIFLYDASNIPPNGLFEESNKIAEAYTENRSIENIAKWFRSSELNSNSFQINVRQLIISNLFNGEYEPLGELVEKIQPGHSIDSYNLNNDDGIPFIQVKDLNEGSGITALKEKDINNYVSDIELIPNRLDTVSPNSILIAKVGNKLKPSLMDGSWYGLHSSNIILLRPKAEIINAEYLITQLQSEYVQKQFQAIRRYSGIPTFNLRDLKSIMIKVVPYDEQLQFVASFYSQKIQNVETSATKNTDDALYNVISRIKHEINQPISSIGIDLKLLITYLNKKSGSKEPVSINDFVTEPLEGQSESDKNLSKIDNILNRMSSCISDAQMTLKKAEETLNLKADSFNLQSVDLKQLLENSVLPLYENANCSFIVKGISPLIKADPYQIKLLFKNLFDNAIKHGFAERAKRDENEIIIQFNKILAKGQLETTVMNNGKSFPKGFNKQAFETRGDTSSRDSGSGFGGYHIKRIIENHKGEFMIVSEELLMYTDFKVQFKIYLPLTN